ncbi:MAG TPA: hypothetical protein VLX58_21820 [Bryobacteraceae bacterium]|nr:hypothetical protein [Bryobacteraceae bacterium]
MAIAIGVFTALILLAAHASRPRRMNRADLLGLASYEHKARREGAFPFDYLSR